MKKLALIYLVLLLPCLFGLLQDQKQKVKRQRHQINLNMLSKIILDELNEYRHTKMFTPDIKWKQNLASTGENLEFFYNCVAAQEAQQIVEKHTFGDHLNFKKWQDSYQGFTEIAVNVYSSKHITSKKIFAMNVLQILTEKYKSNLVSGFTQGGVGIFPYKKIKGKYAVVLHLSGKGKGKKVIKASPIKELN